MKKVLIVVDFQNLIRFQKVDKLMIRHIYTLLFLFKHHNIEGEREVHVLDRSGISYQTLWKEDSKLTGYIDESLINKPWDDMCFSDYLSIVCHFDLEIAFKAHLEHNLTWPDERIKVFSMINPMDVDFQYVFTRVDELFAENGMLEISEEFKQEYLLPFRRLIYSDYTERKNDHYEILFNGLKEQIVAVNHQNKKKQYRRVLIMDDHKRRLFIGDSVVWFTFMRRLVRCCGDIEEAVVNCENARVFYRLSILYGEAFQTNVSFLNLTWDKIDFASYDLVILESDLVLKFLLYINPLYNSSFKNTYIYTVSPLTDNPSYVRDKWDFFEIHEDVQEKQKELSDYSLNSDKELFIFEDEIQSAGLWLESQGITDNDELIIILNSSSRDLKVILPEELIKLITLILSAENNKILIFEPDFLKNNQFRFTAYERERIICAASPGIRQDMNILVSRYTKGIIGPCTGMMHLANSACVYLANHQIRSRESLPHMMVYTGKQFYDIDYLPQNWWNDTLVSCIVIIKKDNKNTLVPLSEIEANPRHFTDTAQEVKYITADMLYNVWLDDYQKSRETIQKEIFKTS